jgi:integrase
MPRRPSPWFWEERGQWVVNINRVRHYLGPNKKEAFEEFYRLMRQPADLPKVSAESVAAIVDTFLSWVQKHRAPDTYEWYRFRCERFCQCYPDLSVEHLRPFHVQEWADSYDFSRTSRRNYLRAVKRAFSWARKQGYIDSNPIAHLEIPAADRREIVISEAEYASILDATRHESFRDLLDITWETGCRPQESLRVEARHVDLANERWFFPASEAKGERRPRIVYLTDSALAITRRLIAANPEGRLFRNSKGGPWTVDAVTCCFDRVQERMGKQQMEKQGVTLDDDEISSVVQTLRPTRKQNGKVVNKTEADLRFEAKRKLRNRLVRSIAPRYSLYAIRHSWATHALERGVDSITVAVLMGHSDPSTLARVYQHVAQNPDFMKREAMRAVGKA